MNGQAGRARAERRRRARAVDGTAKSAPAGERVDNAVSADAADVKVVPICDKDDTLGVYGDASRLTEARIRSSAIFSAAQRRARERRDASIPIDHADTIRLRISHI